MLRLRRSEHEMRIEIMPLIDVIFLLLTFFIYAMVLMKRADLLPMALPEFASAEPGVPSPAVTVSIDRDGAVYLDRAAVDLGDIVPRLQQITTDDPSTKIYLAAAAQGDVDRLPTFLALYDELSVAGLDITLVSAPKDDTDDPAP